MDRRRWRAGRIERTAVGLAAALAVAVSHAAGLPAAIAAFVDNDAQAASTFGAAPDWIAPEVGTTVVAKATGYLAGSIKQGGTYYVYANVTDSGNPPSGVAADGEAANVSAITAGGSAAVLAAGSYSAGGVAYNHRSAALVADATLAAGNVGYSITSRDVAGNSRTQTGYNATVDNTAPAASNVQTTNVSGGTQGRAQLGDTITFTYTERIDPESVLAGWTGSSTNVVVRLIDGGCLLNLLVTVCNDDSVGIYDAANLAALALGSVDLNRGDYHGTVIGTQSPLTFGATGTASTMVQSGSSITITLGTGSATADTAGGSGTMAWAPSALAYDAAGNASAITAVNESGTADKDF